MKAERTKAKVGRVTSQYVCEATSIRDHFRKHLYEYTIEVHPIKGDTDLNTWAEFEGEDNLVLMGNGDDVVVCSINTFSFEGMTLSCTRTTPPTSFDDTVDLFQYNENWNEVYHLSSNELKALVEGNPGAVSLANRLVKMKRKLDECLGRLEEYEPTDVWD